MNQKIKKNENQKEITLKKELNKKVEREYNNFKKELEQKTAKEVIEYAYELVVKNEIKDEIQNEDYTKEELKAMLKEDDLLTEFYSGWLNVDGRLGEVIQYSMDDTVQVITENYTKDIRTKNKESR